jgi:hypothetical protein
LSAGQGSPEEEAADKIWTANPYSYGPQSNPFESDRRLKKLNVDSVNPVTSAEESYGGYNAFIQTNQDDWENNDKLYADIQDR